jgi:beta-galactosidase/beta-glucuronidase
MASLSTTKTVEILMIFLISVTFVVCTSDDSDQQQLFLVNKHSRLHSRLAPWKRTLCGTVSQTPQPDVITQWGASVNPNNVWPEYPRPQLMRDEAATVTNLNGLWEFQLANGHGDTNHDAVFDDPIPFNLTLNQTILVPFPLESCLSGAFMWPLYSQFMFYRTIFDAPALSGGPTTLLHFEAIDWNATIYVNGEIVATHLGGYDFFSVDVTAYLRPMSNELIVAVYDPSDSGNQPAGKQFFSTMQSPGSVFYTPNSGIWGTVWLESVPQYHISSLKISADMVNLELIVSTSFNVPGIVSGSVYSNGSLITTFMGDTFTTVYVPIPNPILWSISKPFLYDLVINVSEPSTMLFDSVKSYFGMRKVGKKVVNGTMRPTVNDYPVFISGVLDQSYWPDGIYMAPSDAALQYDFIIMQSFGFNAHRGHQKYGSRRWFWHADRFGVAVLQDMVGTMAWHNAEINSTRAVNYFLSDFKAMIDGRFNNPSILQWTAFNEGDCVQLFDNVTAVMDWLISYDPTRNKDTNSGGSANSLNIGDVQDQHCYPQPCDTSPNEFQYSASGEYGGLGVFNSGHEWAAGKCSTYVNAGSNEIYISNWTKFAASIASYKQNPGLSVAIYTQLSDVETECDGWINYDRTAKFSPEQIAAVKAINEALISM